MCIASEHAFKVRECRGKAHARRVQVHTIRLSIPSWHVGKPWEPVSLGFYHSMLQLTHDTCAHA